MTSIVDSRDKIVFLGKLPPPYIGPTVATKILLNSRLADKYKLIHLDTSDHREINTLGVFDLKNILLPFWHYARLFGLIIHHKPQAVYFPSAQTTVAYFRDIPFILIAKAFGKKVIAHLRGGNFKNWYDGASSFTQWIVRRMQRLVDAQIVLGECLVDMFTDLIPREKIFVVPNGGDFPIVKKSTGSNDKIRILYLANLMASKGILEVLYSAPEVVTKFPQVEYVFAGSWQETETQAQFIRFLKKHPELPIIIMPPVKEDEKFNLLASAEIFVFPTYYVNEGHPWCILEAMASSLPIITTNHGAISETVQNGVNGFIIEKKNSAAVAEKLKQLLADSDLRSTMGESSRRLYDEKYTEQNCVENMRRCFERTLARSIRYIPEKWNDNYILKKSFKLRRNNVIQLFDQFNNKGVILDAGCGTGNIISELVKKYGLHAIGLDESVKMVEWCKSKYSNPNLNFMVGDIKSLKFPDNTFDCVLSISVMEWIYEYEKVIKEVARILKPGGNWIVSLPNWRSPFRKMQRVIGLIKKNYYVNFQQNHLHISVFKNIAKINGLIVENEIYHLLPLFSKNIKVKSMRQLSLMCMLSMKKGIEENLNETTSSRSKKRSDENT